MKTIRTAWLSCLTLLLSATAVAAPGDLDCSFGTDGKLSTGFTDLPPAYDAALQPDGRFVAVSGGSGTLQVTRLLPGGDRDPTFGNGGTVVHPMPGLVFASAVAIDGAGRIVVAGRAELPDPDAFAARLTSTGAIDTSFGGGDGWISFDFTPATNGVGLDNVTALAIDGSDRPVIAGYADANAAFNPSNSEVAIARLTVAGALDPAFGGGDGLATASSPGTSHDDDARAIVIDTLGRIVTTGATSWPNANPAPRNTIVARWSSAGVLDAAFDGDGVRVVDMSLGNTDDFGVDVTVDASDRAILLSSVGDDPTLGRLLDNGTLDAAFDGDGIVRRSFLGGQDVIERVVVQADGKLLVTGWPVVPPGSFHFASMRVTDTGALDTSWGGTGVVTTAIGFQDRGYSALLQSNQRLVMLGSAGSSLGAARYLTDGDVLTSTLTTITADAPDPSPAGEPVTINVAVAATSGAVAPAGSVLVRDGPSTCTAVLVPAAGASATGSCDLVFSAAGARTVSAQFSGATSFCRSSASTSHQVARAVTTTTIVSDTPDPTVSGDAFTVQFGVTSALAGTPTGNVTVGDGVNSCTGTVAAGSCSLTLTTGGTRNLVAAYAGDTNYANGSSTPPEPHAVNLRVTPVAGAGGTISPSGPQIVALDDTTPFTVTADPGFHVQGVSGCGGSLAGGTYTTGPVTTNCTVAATFNANPVANDGSLGALEDGGAVTGMLGASDADPLVYSIVDAPDLGAVLITDTATGAYQYTPAPNANGGDSFQFRVNDGGANSNVATVAITITAVNDPPAVSFPLPATHPAGTSGAQSIAGFAAFDAGPVDEDATQQAAEYIIDGVSDPDGVLTAGSVTLAASGGLGYSLTGTGGTATVTVRARDDGGTANGGNDTSAPNAFSIVVAPGADLQVGKTDERSVVVAGQVSVYAVVVANGGPNAANGATLTDLLPANLINGSWSCVQALSNTPCPTPAAGSGDLVATIDLPVGGFLRFDVMATVDGSAGATVTNTASAVPPNGTTALDSSNDSATDQNLIVPDGVFADGFEASSGTLSVPGANAALHAD